MWNVLIVLGGVVLSAKALPTPAPIRSNPLLNATVLPVLAECSSAAQGEKKVGELCNLYVHVITNQSIPTTNITAEFEEVLKKPEPDTGSFCDRLLTYPGVGNFLPKKTSCIKRCELFDDHDDMYVRALCRLILWRLEVQNVEQAMPEAVGDLQEQSAVTVGSAESVKVVTNTTVKQEGAKTSTPLQPALPAAPAVTPSGSVVNKGDIPPVVPLGSEILSTSTKASDDVPKVPEDEKPKEEVKINPEPPKTNSQEKFSTQAKPPEEIKKQPDVEEDQNEPSLKELENENPEDYDNSVEREEAAVIKADQDNLEGDNGLFLDKSEPKDETNAVERIDVVDSKQQDPFQEEEESNFFTYFMCMMIVCILAYVAYHNKTKVLALVLEGRRSSQGRNGRRKHTAAYRKLDSNLEEAITSSAASRTQQIIN